LLKKKQTATVVLQLTCLLTAVYFYYYLRFPILWSVFISLFSFFRATNANPQLAFSESPTFAGTQHYLQSDVKVLHFTRLWGDIFQVW